MKKICKCFFTLFTWGEGAEEGRTQIKIDSSKKWLKTCNFKIVVFCSEAEQSPDLLSKRTLLFLFHKRWNCVLTYLAIVARVWFRNIFILTLFSIFLSRWKKFVIVFLHLSLGGKVRKRGGLKLKLSAQKMTQNL